VRAHGPVRAERRPDEGHALAERRPEIGERVRPGGEGLQALGAAEAGGDEPADPGEVPQPVWRIRRRARCASGRLFTATSGSTMADVCTTPVRSGKICVAPARSWLARGFAAATTPKHEACGAQERTRTSVAFTVRPAPSPDWPGGAAPRSSVCGRSDGVA
jgi:hypothetical protein